MNIDNTGQRDQARIFKLIKRMVTAVVALNKDLQAGWGRMPFNNVWGKATTVAYKTFGNPPPALSIRICPTDPHFDNPRTPRH